MSSRRLRAGLLWLVLSIALSLGQACAATAGADVVTLNFVNADIDGVVKAISEMTGKNFVVDPRVKGTVNIVSAKPVSKALAYDVFLSALRLQGYAAVEDGGIVKILPENDAKLHQSLMLGPLDKTRGAGDRIQTQVFTLKYESAVQMMPILRPLIAPNNTITPYQNSNSLVITDYASNLQRLEKIIDAIDQPNSSDPIMIPLRYATALDVAQTVNRLFAEAAQAQGGAAADTTQRLVVVADTRSNSLLARSTGDPSRLGRLRQFVAMLDSPTSAGGNIHVIYLKNAEAVKLAETLRAIQQGESGSGGSSAARSGLGLGSATPLNSSVTGASSATGSSASNSMATSSLSSIQGQPSATASGIIQADAATNSLIITAPDAIYNNLRSVVDRLDMRRAQVYVEALIAEITSTKAAEFGIQWQDLNGLNKTGTQGFGGTNFGTTGQNILGVSANPLTAGAGLNIGVLKGSVSIGGVNILNLGMLVRALQTDSSTNILSTPTLLTLDNEEARIVVGQNVPFITGQYAVSAAATTPTPFQTIERKDVGLTLRLKPQISEGGTVRLQIYQEVSSIDTSTANAAGVVTNKRSVESNVLVDDGQIVVLGGLISDSLTDEVDKVPLLGDLPIVGGLFKYSTRTRAKTNLMVFLRPTVLRGAHSADDLTGGRYDYILNEQGKASPAGLLLPVEGGPPTLPALPKATTDATAATPK